MMKYSLDNYKFKTEEFFPEHIFNRITEIRVDDPEVVINEAKSRVRRKKITKDGKLTILAADHPARRVTKVGDDPLKMGNRLDFLGRILRVITSDQFDGVMSTPDIIEDLFIVNNLVKKNGGKSFLDEKIILGCMNRGGLSGTIFEMDDRFTSFTSNRISYLKLDGAKLMFRIYDEDLSSGKTINYCAKVINELTKLKIPVFLEALSVEKINGVFKTQKNIEDIIKVVGVASALGETSLNTWLKIPYCEGYEKVAKSTTMPILMLGGEARGDPTVTLKEFSKGLKLGKNVRGALVGRNILYPGDDDPMAVAMAVHKIVHNDYSVEAAVKYIISNRGKNLDVISKWIK